MKVSGDKRELRLWAASRQYMWGEITLAQLKEVEYHDALRFQKAVMKHARRMLRRSI